jgi:hypothetical protein
VQLFFGVGGLDTSLKFGGEHNTDLELSTTAIAASYPLGDRTLLRAGGGWVHDGTLATPGEETFTFESGGLAFAGVDHRLDDGAGWTPSLDLSGTLGFTWGRTVGAGEADADYRATDLRLGLRTTWEVGRMFFPYAALRLFGGPVNWDREGGSLSGSDVHHYQLAVGFALRLRPIILTAEFAGAGERGASAGIGTAW